MTLRPSRRAVLSAAAVLLTGCSEVPSQGPVKRADDPRAAARKASTSLPILLQTAHPSTSWWAGSCRRWRARVTTTGSRGLTSLET